VEQVGLEPTKPEAFGLQPNLIAATGLLRVCSVFITAEFREARSLTCPMALLVFSD
jgi:hypothetical protein